MTVSVGSCKEFPTFTDAVNAGSDFRVQGEYVGHVGGELPIGIQVIALGDQQFQGVLYSGGLPGVGWNESTVFHCAGQTRDGRTVFHGIHGERLKITHSTFTGTIHNGIFEGQANMFRGRLPDCRFRLTKVDRKSPTLGARPPAGARVLFDGNDLDQWQDGRLIDGQLLDVGTTSKGSFGDVRIHLEFCCPFMPTARGMQRGNSGVYVKREWEVQILDSFGWHHENRKFERLSKFGRCGGLHELAGPSINMSLPPLSWQTYDIEFKISRWDAAGNMISPSMMSVNHNGVLIHDNYVLPAAELNGNRFENKQPEKGPIYLQDHGNPVRYRNIWVVE